MKKLAKNTYNSFFGEHFIGQIGRFGVIGVTAAIVNFMLVLYLVSAGYLSPLAANILAFLIAFQVSFWGHKHWTFRCAGRHLSSLSKFFIVAAVSFLLNEGLFATFLKAAHLYYPVALILTLAIVPPLTFLFSKVWAFKHAAK